MDWKGTPLFLIITNLNKSQYPDVKRSDHHIVLINLPVKNGNIPEPYLSDNRDIWSGDYVRLPCSKHSLYAVGGNLRNRWELIKEVYQSLVLSSQQFETAVLRYNSKFVDRWNFCALHTFFSEVCEKVECDIFFQAIFPKIVKLAFQLPELIAAGIPLLKRHSNRSITLSQLQVASLLANAFLCTYPRRNTIKTTSEYGDYPSINFNRLFQIGNIARKTAVHEKLKCLIHYFKRVTDSPPTGVITYSRYFVPALILPDWKSSKKRLQKLHVSSSGTIEDSGAGLLHMDFANRFVGGGVLGHGAVQEEIRFVICPELILARLFTQCLGETEVLVVTGCERYSNYKGYGDLFIWDGNYVDNTPVDNYGRKYCTVVAIDALSFDGNSSSQFYMSKIKRELNKVYVGFSWGIQCGNDQELCGIATGNWGCGAFHGDVYLKTVLQLMASAETLRPLAYFTFDDKKIRDDIYNLHRFLLDNNVTVGTLYEMLYEYSVKQLHENTRLFDFLYRAVVNKSIPRQVEQSLSKVSVKSGDRRPSDNMNDAEIEKLLAESDDDNVNTTTDDSIRKKSHSFIVAKKKTEKTNVDVMEREKNKWTAIKAFERELSSTIDNIDKNHDNVENLNASDVIDCGRSESISSSNSKCYRTPTSTVRAKLQIKRKITDYFGNNTAKR